MHDGLFFLLLFLFLLSSAHTQVGGADTRSFVYAGCSADSFPTGSPYQYNLNSLLSSLANSAGFSLYNNFTSSVSSSSSSLSPAYGLYQCRFDVSISDCETCVSSAISWLSSKCPSAASAAVQLHGCLVRYSNKGFVGRRGKELMHKTCGPTVAASRGGGDLMAMKESVFDMLNGGNGLVRVGRSGYVGGSAQCVGDQSAKHCKGCVGEVVADLRSNCGGAVSGEVYLGKCYAEFWSRGIPYHHLPYDSKNDHASEVGKDIAIIIGIVAAVLLIILFLSHLKKPAEEKDGAGKY